MIYGPGEWVRRGMSRAALGLALASLFAALAWAAPDGGPDAGAADAAPSGAMDAGPAPDAAPPEPAAPAEPAPVPPADLTAVTQHIEQLKALLDGRLPLDTTVGDLFAVDLLDDAAVTARLATLRARVDGIKARRDWLLARAAPPPPPPPTPPPTPKDAGVPDGGASDGGAASADQGVAGPAARPESGAPKPLDAGLTPVDGGASDGAVVDAAPPARPEPIPLSEAEQAEVDRAPALLARDALLLDVLSRPLAARKAMVDAQAERRRLASEEAAAEAARKAAEAAAERAEAARLAALAEAAQARSEAERLLAEARAAIEAHRGALADAGAALAAARVSAARDSTAWRDLAQRAGARLEDPGLPAAEADELYEALVAALIEARQRFDLALDRLGDPPSLPGFQLTLDVDEGRFRALPAERDAVLQAREAMNQERAALRQQIEEGQSGDAERLAQDVSGLNRVRLALLPRLSADKRARVLGLGTQGLEQLARELAQLKLSTRWYLRRRPARLAEVPRVLLDALGHGNLRWQVFQAVGLLLLGLVFAIRRRRWLEALDGAVTAWREGYPDRRWAARAWPHARALVPALVMWGVTVAGFAAAGRVLPDVEVRVLGQVAVMVVTYRLVIAVVHRALVWLAGTPLTPVDPALSARLLRSVRIVGRYVLVVQAFLAVAQVILGRGYLYTVVEEFAWLGTFPIGWWLLRHWHPDLVRAYEDRAPSGWLVPWIRRSEGRWWRLVLAAPAFVHVAAQVLGRTVVRLSLRVGRIRRALAFLFRRRLERAAGERVVASAGPALPAEVLARLVAPATTATRIDRFPGLDETVAAVQAWRRDGRGGPVSVVGTRGVGKSTWIAALTQRCPDAVVLHLEAAPTSAAAALTWLAESLGVPPATEPEALVASLRRGPKRLVVVDDAHHFLRRAPGGVEVLNAVLSVLRRTSQQVFWVFTQARYMAAYQRFVLRDVDVFRQVHRLEGWSEEGLADLVERRLADVGLAPVWDDLMLEPARTFDREEQVARTRERYLRLLWDHVDGVPGTALHFFAQSLVADGPAAVRVRLFEHPRADDLEGLSELGRFVLNAVVLHDGLDWAEAPAVLQLDAKRARAVLEQLESLGCLVHDTAGDRWRVPDGWYPAALRFLRRKNLLHV